MFTAKTIFIADDDVNLVDALSLRCENLGFKTRKAYNGLDATVEVVTNPPDLLILDVDMPGANGICVCKKITEFQYFAPIPIILLTGTTNGEPKNIADELNAHYVRKDANTWGTLLELIPKLLDDEGDRIDGTQIEFVA